MRSALAEASSLVDFLKALSIKAAFFLMDNAWRSLKGKSIRAVWDKALGDPFSTTTSPEEDESDDEEFLGFTQEEIQAASDTVLAALEGDAGVQDFIITWAALDEDVPTVALNTREDFIREAQGEEEPEEQEDSTPHTRLPLVEVLDMTTKLQLHYESMGDIDRAKSYHSDGQEVKKQLARLKNQQKITDLFKTS